MQGFIVERITHEKKLYAQLFQDAMPALRLFARCINEMGAIGTEQVAFRDVSLTVATLAVSKMPLPKWALVKVRNNLEERIEFYCREVPREERKKVLDDLRRTELLGGYKAAYFYNIREEGIFDSFVKEE